LHKTTWEEAGLDYLRLIDEQASERETHATI